MLQKLFKVEDILLRGKCSWGTDNDLYHCCSNVYQVVSIDNSKHLTPRTRFPTFTKSTTQGYSTHFYCTTNLTKRPTLATELPMPDSKLAKRTIDGSEVYVISWNN